MLKQKSIEMVVKNNLCTGCGACEGVCPEGAVHMQRTRLGYFPSIEHSLCTECGLCFNICPGHAAEVNRMGGDLFPASKENKYLGRYIDCFTGFSTDDNIRFHCASGGMVSQLLIFMLENKIIDGAIVTRMQKDNPTEPEVIIARARDEVLQGKSSKYCPVPLNTILKVVKNLEGRFAFVGLPCHIHALRKIQKSIPSLRDKIAFCFGLFCSGNRTFEATEYILKSLNIPKEKIINFAYRDEGWLGNLVVKQKDETVTKIPYRDYYHRLRSFFIPYRCTLCIDHCAELADISFGDIYIPEFWDDRIGINSLITRSRKGQDLLHKLVLTNAISIKNLNPELLIKSQKNMLLRKKIHIQFREIFLRIFNCQIPNHLFDPSTKISCMKKLKYLIPTIILYTELKVGSKRALWFFIKYLNILAQLMNKGLR